MLQEIPRSLSIIKIFFYLVIMNLIIIIASAAFLVALSAAITIDEQIEQLNTEIQQLNLLLEKIQEPEEEPQEVEEVMTFIKMEATAYTHTAVAGVPDINGTGDGLTYTETQVREGIIAVDPRIIPLGSTVYVKSDFPGVEGYYTAEDTGKDIKENKIDIFMECRNRALQFGRREVEVAIIK